MPTQPGDTAAAAGSISRRLLVLGIGGGILLLAQLSVLTVSLGEIISTRDHVAATDTKAERALAIADPLAEDATSLLERAVPLSKQAEPAVRAASELLRPLSDRGDDLSRLIERFPLLEFGLRQLVGEALPLISAIDLPTLASTTALVRELATVLIENDRLARTLDQASNLLSAIDERNLVVKGVRSARTLREVLEIQTRTFDVQGRVLRILQESLRTQRLSLDHIRSIDEKTGGELPPIGP